jgi:hypothetical protein
MLPSSLDMNGPKPMSECLSDESLAALLDGELDEPARRAAAEHLAGCDDCRELLIESRASLPATPAPGTGWTGRLPAIIAGLAVAAGLAAMTFRTLGTRDAPDLASPVAAPPMEARSPDPVALLGQSGGLADLARHEWTGAGIAYGFGPTRNPSTRAALLGVRLVDLEIAVALRDERRAARIYRDIENDLGAAIPPMRSLDELLPRLNGIVMASNDPDAVAFGRWLEAARLAAVGRRATFWSSPEPARVLSAASSLLPPPLRARVSRALESVPPRTEAAWQALERILDDAVSVL